MINLSTKAETFFVGGALGGREGSALCFKQPIFVCFYSCYENSSWDKLSEAILPIKTISLITT